MKPFKILNIYYFKSNLSEEIQRKHSSTSFP